MSLIVSSTSFNLVVRASIFHFISVMTLLTSAWLYLSSIISALRDSPVSFVPFSAPDCYLHKDCSEFQLQRLTSWLIKSMAGSITSGSFFGCEFLLLVVLFREERRKEREWGGGGEEKKKTHKSAQTAILLSTATMSSGNNSGACWFISGHCLRSKTPSLKKPGYMGLPTAVASGEAPGLPSTIQSPKVFTQCTHGGQSSL